MENGTTAAILVWMSIRVTSCERGMSLHLLVLLLLIVWQAPAYAFFCFTFGGQARHDNRFGVRAWQPPPPPPQLLMPNLSLQTARTQGPRGSGDDLPPIRKTKKSPELIQGFRFRPLDEGPPQSAPIKPRDWRD